MNRQQVTTAFKGLDLTEANWNRIQKVFTELRLKKGEQLLKAGEEARYQYYVMDGCLRTYFLDDKAKEHTVQFAITDWWISDYMGYFLEGPSELYIESISEAVVFKVAKEDMDILMESLPEVTNFYRKKLERATVRFQKRILYNLAYTAKERYLQFLKQYPNIEQQIKNYHLASYLGITTESLSRIRKELQ